MLENLKIASPCSANWDDMVGDERIRHCSECNRNVYNFSAMSGREIERLLVAAEGRLCGRWYRRADGTILTQDCPVGLRRKLRRVSLIAGTALSALLGAAAATAESSAPAPRSLVKIENPEKNAGEIAIKVADASGALITRAKISIVDSKNRIIAGQTDEGGRFSVRGLRDGSYSVRVVAPGFETESREVSIESGLGSQTAVSLQLKLSVAVMGEVISVPDANINSRESNLSDVLPLATPGAAAPHGSHIRRFFSKAYNALK